MTTRIRPILTIVALGLLFFGPLVAHPGWVLYSDGSDLLGLHLPIARFLVGSWRATGEMPLWCPLRFGGSPFLHDLQAGIFYPPHLILYALPGSAIGPAMSWLIVAHVIVAGLGMYAYARRRALGRRAATVAALGFMFSGKWMLHLLGGGHYATVGLAWLPLVLLILESAIRRASLLRATWAGTAFALLCLGTHPQWTLYTGVFLVPWTLATALEGAGCWRGTATSQQVLAALGRWLACGLCAATMALLLVAVQLLPSLEAASEATRGIVGTTGGGLSKAPLTLFSLVGPPALGMKSFDDWEYRGGLGVLWVWAATMAALGARGRARFEAAVWLGLIGFALGGAALVQGLPGFRLFVLPSRMLLIATLPAALLAGRLIDDLIAGPVLTPARIGRCRGLLRGMTVAAVLSFAVMALLRRSVHGHAYWIVLALTVPAALAIVGRGATADFQVRRRVGGVLGLLLLADLWGMAWPHVAVRPETAVFVRPSCVDYLLDHAGEQGRVLDRHLSGQVTRTPVSSPLAMMLGIESVRGYNPLDILRFRDYLQFVAGRDAPPPPIRQVANFPVINKPLLDLLGVRYLAQPIDPTHLPAGERPIAEDPGWKKVAEDSHPRTFNIFAGMASLPPYAVFENRDCLPRAFVVPDASPLPDRSRVLEALRSTDFRRRVFLEGPAPERPFGAVHGTFRPAQIRRYVPNRVEVGVDGDSPGYLVLADPWFPGWSCAVDGHPARLHRANYLFRAVAVPAGHHEVTFTFAPASYRLGKLVSSVTLLGVLGWSLLALGWRGWGRKETPDEPSVRVGLRNHPHRSASRAGAETAL